MHTFLLLALLVALSLPAAAAPEGWTEVFADDFGKADADAAEARALDAPWVPLRGDWFVTRDATMRTQRVWPSDSAIMLDKPLRGVNVRAEMTVAVGPNDSVTPCLQAGECLWGGGGIRNLVGVRLIGKGKPHPNAGPGEVIVEPHVPHRVVLQIEDGQFLTQVDGKTVQRGEVAQGRSLVNCRFGVHAIPNGELDALRIFTRPLAEPTPIVATNTPEENRRATVYAKDTLDDTDAAHGFQKALDSLPPAGGVCILPEGRFLMRRHLQLRSGVTLRGQGAGKTTLIHCDTAAATIVTRATDGETHTVTLDDASAFRVGDATCFGSRWGHPGTVGVRAQGNYGVMVLAKDGNTLTISEPAPEKPNVLTHFFPLVFARGEEFVEVKDLTLIGPRKNEGGGKGGFMTNLITLGSCYGSRVTRIEGIGFPADGVSMQGGADAIVTDNTISETSQAFHPGTTTLRYLWSRNLAFDNGLGLYFCWYNSNGVYTRSTYDGMAGYPDAGDFHNVIAFNRDSKPFRITNGASGVYFGNRCEAIDINAKGRPERHLYAAAPRYFVIAANVCEKVSMGENTLEYPPAGNVIAANRTPDGKPTPLENIYPDNIATPDGPTDFDAIGAGCGRDKPVAPPALPEPVLDGATYYDPASPTCGFQKALDELKAKGGTLRLPAGRYPLSEPLNVPSNVTLCGQGMATVLVRSAKAQQLIRVKDAENVTVRELALDGAFAPVPGEGRVTPVALSVETSRDVWIVAVDVRGWADGLGLHARSVEGLLVMDCRFLECSLHGVAIESSARVRVQSSQIVRSGGLGLLLDNLRNGPLVEGNILAGNRGPGIAAMQCEGVRILANNVAGNALSDRGGMGIGVQDCADAVVAGNMVLNNGQGIALMGKRTTARVLYNRCGDDRTVPVQTDAILAKDRAAGRIAFNSTAPQHGDGETSIQADAPATAVHNWQRTVQPTGTSIEDLRAKEEAEKAGK